ncbi:MAG: 2-amino-4-hydroxy-6-hydroxymethyldihydropteridine diphosphokinase [Pseudomonadota bacterium]
MTVHLIALGANLPGLNADPGTTLNRALSLLATAEEVTSIRCSRWFRSPAFPTGSGPDFVNGAARVEADLTPAEMLAQLHAIEEELGRTRKTRWEPRTCDLDLIASGAAVLPDMDTLSRWMEMDLGKAQTAIPPHLILPHPRMQERAFVLLPLMDVAPDWIHPLTMQNLRDMVAALPSADRAAVVPLE